MCSREAHQRPHALIFYCGLSSISQNVGSSRGRHTSSMSRIITFQSWQTTHEFPDYSPSWNLSSHLSAKASFVRRLSLYHCLFLMMSYMYIGHHDYTPSPPSLVSLPSLPSPASPCPKLKTFGLVFGLTSFNHSHPCDRWMETIHLNLVESPVGIELNWVDPEWSPWMDQYQIVQRWRVEAL